MSTTTRNDHTMDIPVDHYSIDFKILEILEEGRNVPIVIADRLDNNRNYVSNRLRELKRYGMVDEISEKHSVGLYELTDLGRVAVEHSDLWDDDRDRYREIIDEHAT